MPVSDYIRRLREKVGTELIMMPGVTAVIRNERGEVLLQKATGDGRWYAVGGGIDPEEEPADAVVREVAEETGLSVEPVRVVGVYADPVATYPNGDRVFYVSTCFECRITGGTLRVNDDESLELRYFPPDRLPEMLPTHRHRIEQALANEDRAYFAWKERK
jgi:8-oxo-dGTP pyrophosphatase MutT (NUDIX family)